VRILVCTRHAQALGGAESYLREVLPALAARGHVLSIGVELPSIRTDADWTLGTGFGSWLLERGSVARQLEEFRPDAIFNNQIANPELEQALLATGKASLFLHSYSGLCISGRRMHQLPEPTPCERAFGLACLALYFPRRCGGLDPIEMARMYALQSKRHRQLFHYHRLIVPSTHLRRMLLQAGVDETRIVVAAHAVAPPGETPSERAGADPPVLLFLGRLTLEKGCLLLPEAVRLASELTGRKLRLEIAGDGPLRNRLHERLVARKIDFVFHGWVDDARRGELLRRANLLVFPSVWLEPFGLVGIEAAREGVPAVAFPHGGVEQWLVPGVTGELADRGRLTARKFAEAIARALSSPEHLQLLSRNARVNAGRFRLDEHVRTLEAALAST
jgi:glycosyltransferase involved in cell wall biosynthesis